MKEQIRQLIRQARIKEALELLSKQNPDASSLMAKFTDAEKKYRLGLLDYDDYSKKLSEVTYGALGMVDELTETAAPATTTPVTPTVTPPPVTPPVAPPVAPTQATTNTGGGLQVIKIFLASSAELKDDRQEFEIFINRQNNQLISKGKFLQLVLWEDFIDAMSATRLQDEYNKALLQCDFVVSLFFTKVGKFTGEEFDAALAQFKATGKPYIYTYFKNAPINTGDITDNVLTLLQFKKRLSDMGHFFTPYENTDGLLRHFGDQLRKLNIA